MGARNKNTLKSEEQFKANYKKHDIVEEYLIERLKWYGFDVNHYGIDHRDGGVEYSSKPDLAVCDGDGDVVGYVDAKAKSIEHEDWFGVTDKRKFENYLYGGEETEDEPYPFTGANSLEQSMWMFMCVVDNSRNVVTRESCIPVLGDHQIEREWRAHHDGNIVVKVDDDYWNGWSDMIESFTSI